MSLEPIPACLNPHSGSASKAIAALGKDSRFQLCETTPGAMRDAVRDALARGARRLLVVGGDGTVAAAAGAAAGTPLELAIFPGGTLNHFARDLGLPLDDPAAALDIAATGTAIPADLGCVNGHVMLNTSAIGEYVDFIRHRDTNKRWLGYHLSSTVAVVRTWVQKRTVFVDVHANDGTHRRMETPLLFVGVGERILDRAGLGVRRPGGASALHVLVVNARTRRAIGRVGLSALATGVNNLISAGAVHANLVTEATAVMHRSGGTMAVDGELIHVTSPVRYELKRAAVTVVRRA